MSANRLMVSSLLLLAVHALPERAEAAGPPVRKVDTRAFSVLIPRDWTLHKRVEYGADKNRISWEYTSPKRNYRFRASIARDASGTLLQATDAAIVRIARRVDDLEIVQKQLEKQPGREMSYVIAKALMVRKKTQQPYLLLQVLVKPAGKKFIVGLYVAASGEKLTEFQKVAQPILESLVLKEPAALFGAAAKAAPRKLITPAKKR